MWWQPCESLRKGSREIDLKKDIMQEVFYRNQNKLHKLNPKRSSLMGSYHEAYLDIKKTSHVDAFASMTEQQ